MSTIFWAEFLGTALLILLGDGVVANVVTRKSGQFGGGSVQITIGWGLAVMIPAYIFGATSGAHFNPAVTLAMAMNGTIETSAVPVYLGGEFLGAFVGACLVYCHFKDHLNDQSLESAESVRGCFCTAPTIPNTWRNLVSEIIGTFVLVFTILGMAQIPQAAQSGVSSYLLWGIITSIGMSLGGTTGYAINPARDLGPRIAYAVLPFKKKVDPNWGYGWIPVVGPLLGAMIAVWIYGAAFPA